MQYQENCFYSYVQFLRSESNQCLIRWNLEQSSWLRLCCSESTAFSKFWRLHSSSSFHMFETNWWNFAKRIWRREVSLGKRQGGEATAFLRSSLNSPAVMTINILVALYPEKCPVPPEKPSHLSVCPSQRFFVIFHLFSRMFYSPTRHQLSEAIRTYHHFQNEEM